MELAVQTVEIRASQRCQPPNTEGKSMASTASGSYTVSASEWATIKAAHPNIRGMFCWSAQTNLSGGNTWGSTMKAALA